MLKLNGKNVKKILTQTWKFIKRFKWYVISGLIIAAIIIVPIWRKANQKTEYLTDMVTRQTVSEEVSESGNVQAEGQAEVYSSSPGAVTEIYVQNGQYVYANQSLFAIRPDTTDAEKEMAYSQYLAAQNGVTNAEQARDSLTVQIRMAKKQLTDATTLYRKILDDINTNPATTYTQADLASAKMGYLATKKNVEVLNESFTNAEATIAAAQEAAAAAKTAYDAKSFLIVKSPSSGYVSNLSIFRGDRVSTSMGLGAATYSPAMIVANTQRPIFKAQINEIDIAKIKLYQSATITIDAIKDAEFSGKVKKIDSIGANAQGVISYNIYVSLENPSPDINVGMSGNVVIETEKHEDVLTVINSAIKPYQDGQAVQVFADNQHKTLKYVPIKTGLKGLERTEISEGLTEGMEIVITSDVNQFKSAIFGG